jgi:hypothetical protein
MPHPRRPGASACPKRPDPAGTTPQRWPCRRTGRSGSASGRTRLRITQPNSSTASWLRWVQGRPPTPGSVPLRRAVAPARRGLGMQMRRVGGGPVSSPELSPGPPRMCTARLRRTHAVPRFTEGRTDVERCCCRSRDVTHRVAALRATGRPRLTTGPTRGPTGRSLRSVARREAHRRERLRFRTPLAVRRRRLPGQQRIGDAAADGQPRRWPRRWPSRRTPPHERPDPVPPHLAARRDPGRR